MPDFDDDDRLRIVFDRIDDPEITLPDAVFLSRGELPATRRPGIGCEPADLFDDPAESLAAQSAQLAGRGFPEEDPISFHPS